ncbi:MAG: class I SAM-dependent methyltransferase [Bacteroidales bacterium]|nr:MAG: class I SAM-dependent methyltransferase [Bacteroidales bacterium]
MSSLFVKSYLKLCGVIPGFRKITRKWMYQLMARFIKQDQWSFMNYGYAQIDGQEVKPILDSSDEVNRLSFQLYHHLANEVNLEDKSLLEVGSGRGGGASMIKKYHKPSTMVGLDYSGNAVKLCNKNHGREGLSFVEGDAENLPFSHESFDAVINVESSHCYESMNRFLGEVKKVLKPGGHFLFTDFRYSYEMEELEKQLNDSQMVVMKKRDITPNVLQALDEDHDRRMTDISKSIPKLFANQFREFAGVKNSVVYNQFANRDLIYFSFILQKQ